MRITGLSLTDVRRHVSLTLHPAAGLTVIRGPNEAGKSTIHEALELVLFRKANTSGEDIRSVRRWGTDAYPGVTLEFEVDGQSGRLVKRFAGSKAEAELTLGESTTRDFALIQEQVAAVTGIPNEAFFRATASVGHAELAEVAGDAPAISDRLQKAVSGADRGTARAKRKLETAIHRYRTEGHKNPGLLKVCRDEITTLERELIAGEAALARLEADRAQWAEAHERRQALELQLTRLQADLAEATRAERLALERDGAQERYDRLKRATELVEELDELRAASPTGRPLPMVRDVVARAVNLDWELSELEAERAVDGVSPDDADRAGVPAAAVSPERWPSPGRWFLLGVSALVSAALAGVLLGGALGAAGAVGLSVIALVFLALAFRAASQRRQLGLAHDLAEHSALARRDLASEREERYRRRRRELEGALGELGVADVPAAQAMLASLEEVTDRSSRVEGELRGLGIQERDAGFLAASRDQAADAADQARHALAALGELGRDPAAARQAAQRSVDQALPARDRARSDADQAQGRVDANLVDAELVAEQAERLVAARLRQSESQRRVRIYEATLRAIEDAEHATLKTAARYLEEHMGPAVARITGGRYRDVQVDDQTLRFRVRAPETGELVDVEQLSQGTSDQLFLAARLGLVRLVTMDRRPPIILDDPFVTFDEERARRALELLREVALEQGFQVILLTCSERFDGLADELVVLEGPQAGATPPSGWPPHPSVTGAPA
jgi:uncharacterized protein YhaN